MKKVLVTLTAALAFAGPAQAGWVQVPQPDPQAGFAQISCPANTTDSTCPAARRYAKAMLKSYVRRGIIARYLPAWDADPAQAWRVVSSLYAASQRGCATFGECN